MPRPGRSTADGQHWVYRLEGHRKCWFQAAEGIATVKKRAHRRVAKHHLATLEANETAGRKQKAAVDARAELLRSTAAETSQPAAPTLEVVDAGPVLGTGIATLVPSAAISNRADDQLTPDHSRPRQIDVETLLAAAPAVSDVVASSAPSAAPVAFPIAEAGDDGRGWAWLGVLLMTVGLVALLSSSRTLRRAMVLHEPK
ncbi:MULTISPECIES: hypothetical protein [unclassified Bradyrhizobium]